MVWLVPVWFCSYSLAWIGKVWFVLIWFGRILFYYFEFGLSQTENKKIKKENGLKFRVPAHLKMKITKKQSSYK